MALSTIPKDSIAADAIDGTKIADDAISEEHLDATAITGSTELAATPADTDEILISDAGTLKRLDFSHIKGGFSKIATITTDNSAVGNFTFDDCFTTSFTQYRIIGFVAPDTNNKPFGFEWRKTSSGSTSTHTGTDYIWTHFGHRVDNGDGTGTDNGGGFEDNYAQIGSHAVHLDNNSSTLSFDMVVTDPRETLLSRCSWHGTLTYTNPTSSRQFVGTFGGKMSGSITTITGITFSFLAVNINFGRITVYGMTQ